MDVKERIDTRVTIYLSYKNWKEYKKRKANKENPFVISTFVNRQLDHAFWNESYGNVEFEIENAKKKLDAVNEQRFFLEDRITELNKALVERGQKFEQLKTLFNKFHNNVSQRVKTEKATNRAIDYDAYRQVLQRLYLPDTVVDVPLVKEIIHRCKNGRLDFNYFEELRKGNNGVGKRNQTTK